MASRYGTQKGLLSQLQWKILRHVCRTTGANYESISRETGRKRTTIIQSIEPLVKNGYIERVKDDPARKNSKLIFKPTYKAKSYALDLGSYWEQQSGIKKLSIEEIFYTETDAHIVTYLKALNQISGPSQREAMLYEFASSLLNRPITYKKGNIKTEDKMSSIKEAFGNGLLDLIHNPLYNVEQLFNEDTKKWLLDFFSRAEIKELISMLLKIKENVDLTTRILSKLGC